MKQLFNSREYQWSDLSVVVLGRPVMGCRAIEYKAKQEKEALYASGSEPRSIQHGRRSYDGTITFTQSELIALDRAAVQKGRKDALDISFDIIVSYLSEEGIVTIDRIVGASLTELPRSMKEGDKNMEIALPFIALSVKPNITVV